jgi:hypothetical protein
VAVERVELKVFGMASNRAVKSDRAMGIDSVTSWAA